MKESRVFRLLPVVLAMVSGLSFALWLFSLDGTRGLLAWMPSYRRIFSYIFIVALCPPAISLPGWIFFRFGKKRLSLILETAAASLSVFLTIGFITGFGFLFIQMHTLPSPLPALNRLDLSINKPLARLAFSSDSHIGNPNSDAKKTAAILRTINAGKYDAFFHLGDIAEMGVPGTDFEGAAALFSTQLPDVPLVTLMGNHDSLVGGSFRYRTIFNKQLYYRLDSGTVHIIALNLLWGTESLDQTQKKWLEKTLGSIPRSDTTIVLSHCFFWASGYVDQATGKNWFDHPAMTAELAPILENSGVDLVISGHNHFMEYLERPPVNADGNGTAYAIIGTLGGALDPALSHTSKYSRWYAGNQFGFLEVDLYAGRMELTFRNERGGELYKVLR